MGGSSLPLKNQCMAMGFVPGLALRLEADLGDGVETLATRVEEVDDIMTTVLVPMRRLEDRPIERGLEVSGTYLFQDRLQGFRSESLGASPDGYYQYLRTPDTIQSADRRHSFRLRGHLRPESVYRLVVNAERVEDEGGVVLECSLLDFSAGGVCLSSKHSAVPGEWLGLHVVLPHDGDFKARMRVVEVEPPPKGRRNYRLHCVFHALGQGEQDRIARYLLHRQLEMRQRGQL